MKLAVMIEPCAEGGFHIWVPSLPGCHSEGDTEAEALENIKEAIALYLDSEEDKVPQPPARRLEVAV
jgi:predicted RNase H-like HicB family nuclease